MKETENDIAHLVAENPKPQPQSSPLESNPELPSNMAAIYNGNKPSSRTHMEDVGI